MTTLTLLALGGPARAQANNPQTDPSNWTVTDANGNPTGHWTVTDANGNPIGNPCAWLTGPVTVTNTSTGAYQQIIANGDPDSLTFFYDAFPPPDLTSYLCVMTSAADQSFTGYWDQNRDIYDSSLVAGALTTQGQSTQSATLTYHPPAGATAPMPDHVDVLLTTTLGAAVSSTYADVGCIRDGEGDVISWDPSRSIVPNLAPTVTVTDTLGDSKTVSESAAPSDFFDIEHYIDNPFPSSVFPHLMRLPVTNGVATASLGATVTATASNDSSGFQYPDGGYGFSECGAGGSVSTTVQIDNREVTLTRDGARQVAFGMLPNGQTYGEWVDSSGTGHGDTVYSYKDYDNNGVDNSTEQIGDHLNWQTFHPAFSGSWNLLQGSPFSWSPVETDDTLNTGLVSMHYRDYDTLEGDPDGQDPPEQRTISETVTDSDGATGTANYLLTVHDPYEHCVDNPPHIVQKDLRRLPYSPSWTSTTGAQSGTVYIEQAQTWGASATISGPLGEWILETLGVSIEANYSFSVNAGASANAGPYPPGYMTYALVYDEYMEYSGTTSTWDTGGFIGTQPYLDDIPTGQIGIEAHDPIWTGAGTAPPFPGH